MILKLLYVVYYIYQSLNLFTTLVLECCGAIGTRRAMKSLFNIKLGRCIFDNLNENLTKMDSMNCYDSTLNKAYMFINPFSPIIQHRYFFVSLVALSFTQRILNNPKLKKL